MKISMLKQGEKFICGGVHWIKLDADKTGVLAIAAESMLTRSFDKDQWNYWNASLLRKELNREFITFLILNGGQWKHFVQMNIDLTAKDGMSDYGEADDSISLLTADLFLQYKDFIPNINQSYWTVTPWSCKEEYLSYVCAISSDGKIFRKSADKEELGVRPICKLKNTIQVEIV